MKSLSKGSLKLAQFALGLALAASLAACGGSDSPATVQVASADTTAAVTATTVAALTSVPKTDFTYPNGFSGTDATTAPVSLTGPTTVNITTVGTASRFAITNGGSTAEGAVSFGSCIFTVGSTSPFADSHPLGKNKVFKVDPCSMTASTTGAVADGTATLRDVRLMLGLTSSELAKMLVTVSRAGIVQIGSTPIGTVTLTTATGAGS